jgi:putrescine aminotransferase
MTETHSRVAESSHWRPMWDMAVEIEPFIIEAGEGSWVIDSAGRRYLDATAALWFAQIGYGRREIADAVHAQMSALHAYHTFGDYSNPRAIELSARLDAVAPGGGWKVFLTSQGSDSVDTAIKFARRYWLARGESARSVVLSRQDAYHGMHVGGTELSGMGVIREGYGEMMPDRGLVDRDDPEDLRRAIIEWGPDRIAAFICEPIVGAGGMYFPREGYLEAVREICREHDVLFIADEVVTGFGRVGSWFASERFNLDPDLILCAKGITSGYVPLGAVLMSSRVAAPFWSGEGGTIFKHGYTYSGHAVAAAAALANLDYIEKHDLLGAARRIESQLPSFLAPLADLSVVHSVRTGPAAAAAVQLDPERCAVDPSWPTQAVHAVRSEGILTRPMSCGAVQISPPLTTTEDELVQMVEGFDRGLRALGAK